MLNYSGLAGKKVKEGNGGFKIGSTRIGRRGKER